MSDHQTAETTFVEFADYDSRWHMVLLPAIADVVGPGVINLTPDQPRTDFGYLMLSSGKMVYFRDDETCDRVRRAVQQGWS